MKCCRVARVAQYVVAYTQRHIHTHTEREGEREGERETAAKKPCAFSNGGDVI